MPILTFPDIRPTVCTWGLRSNTETFVSPLNGAIQTAGRPGSRWKATLEFGRLTLQQGRDLQAFLVAMDGMAGRCYLTNHDRPGTGASATVNGAEQIGTVLNVTGAANRVYQAGDYFMVNNEYKMLTATVTANGAGAAALQFGPMLRASPANGATVTFTNPTPLMMLDQSEFAMPRISGPRYSAITVPFVEIFA